MRTTAKPRAKTPIAERAWVQRLRGFSATARERLEAAGVRARRGLLASGRTLVLVACVAGAIGLARLIEMHVKKSPAFATKVIEVDGTSHLSRETVLAAAGLAEGQNVFLVAPAEAEARLSRHPWIAHVDVERRLPSTYRVHVREHVPVALISLGSTYLLAEDGTVFKRVAVGDPVDLPLVTGVDRERFVSDRAYRASTVLQTVALFRGYQTAGLASRSIAELHLDATGDASLLVGRSDVRVSLGQSPFREKLSRLRQVFTRVDREHLDVEEIFLDQESRHDRVTVRLRGQAPATALASAH